MVEFLTAFLGTWKNQIIGTLIVILLVLSFFTYRAFNKKIGEYQNEIIPIEQTNTPGPNLFDDLCLYISSKPCP
ncbi:hypothetical protein [Leptospira levettii]|uniref:hypothetical protein n=1 Tax=Leptospira levettii TaxID=2023178 RepID=UPI00223DEBA5|nr:hypothetical protein [Leptospira levettii]MCW7475549.1 hypothetical protein [Leptospira levettii]